MECIEIGIDEAGRGPLVGDLVVAGVMAASSVFQGLAFEGAKDSKALSRRERRRLWADIIKVADIAVAFVHPLRIDSENLNLLEAKAICNVLRALHGVYIAKYSTACVNIYVDEVKGILKILEDEVTRLWGSAAVLKMMPKGEEAFPPVAVASIVAKVARDESLRPARRALGDFGSGYPSDERTMEWLRKSYAELPSPPLVLRRSWGTLKGAATLWYRKKGPRQRSIKEFLGKGWRNGNESASGGEGQVDKGNGS